MNTSRLIQKPEARDATELKKHEKGPGIRYVLLDRKKIPETTIYSIIRAVKDLRQAREYVQEHVHDCDSKFLFMGDEDDMTGLKAEVMLDGDRHVIESPAAVFIPKGLPHSVKLLEGSGKFVNTLLCGDYNESTK
jgi:2-isopropylmalate synthase